MATFFCPIWQKNPYIDSCVKPLYNGHFFIPADKKSIHWLLWLSTATSLQQPLSSVPKVAIVDRFNCIFLQLFQFEWWHWKEYLLSFINHNKKQKIFVVLFAMTLTCFGQMTRTLNGTDPVCNMPEKVMLNIHVSNFSWEHRSPQKVLPVLVSGCGQALWGTQTRMFSWLFNSHKMHLLALLSLFTDWNIWQTSLSSLIHFDQWNPCPFIYLSPEKGTPF